MTQPPRPTCQSATWSLVCGIFGLFCGVLSIFAIVYGHQARRQIRQYPYLEGAGMALAGLILGYGSVGLTILIVLAPLLLIGLGLIHMLFKMIVEQTAISLIDMIK